MHVAIFRILILGLLLTYVSVAEAATLNISPSTGVYTIGSTFSVQVSVNTQGKSINAADGTLTFDSSELQVVSVSRAGSIFSLWTAEPSFSNANGRVTFSGGSPSGYSGAGGNVMTVTFRVVSAGSSRVALSNASVLAADGMGTNVLTNMGNGSYTLSAASSEPAPEEIVEFVPPANTPAAPQVVSSTHGDPTGWFNTSTAELSWTLPSGITGVRTLLNERSNSVPTRVYENPISVITLDDLPEGESYFHIQFRNSDGWGRVAHYRLAVDTTPPKDFAILLPEPFDPTSPEQYLIATTSDEAGSAPIVRYKIQINGAEPIEFTDQSGEGIIELPALETGYQTIVIEAFDAAGNSTIASRSLTILAFDKPELVDIPNRLLTGTVPVFRGLTRPNSSVEVTISPIGATSLTYNVTSNEAGEFSVIPERPLMQGVYEITARATDQHGAKSDMSESVRFVVDEPGYIAIGSMLINILSIIVTLVAVATLLFLIGSYMFIYVRRLRKNVSVEAEEVLLVLNRQFDDLQEELSKRAAELSERRKSGKLTKPELDLVNELGSHLQESKVKITKEVADVIGLVQKEK